MGKKTWTKEKFVEKSREIHGDLYNYDEFEFSAINKKGRIYCTKHDLYFEQTPEKHMMGQGCSKCRYEKSAKGKTKSFDEFKKKAEKIHEGKYDYSKAKDVYVNVHTKIPIICPEHGEFWQTPNNHTNVYRAQGCPECGKESISESRKNSFLNTVFSKKGEDNNKYLDQLIDSIEEFYKGKIEKNVHTIIPTESFSIVLPDEKIIFDIVELDKNNELQKPYRYRILRHQKCNELGYRIYSIFEDEILYKYDIVLSKIRNILNLTENKIYARQCEIKEVSPTNSTRFLEENHLQGRCGGQYKFGLYYNNELVSLMVFGKGRLGISNDKEKFELLRFCNKKNTNVIGGASRLLKHFTKNVEFNRLISFADRRWSDGGLYRTLGFTLYNESDPNYYYIVGNKRLNRMKFRKNKLVKQGFSENMSEHEIMLSRGIYRITDCGCLSYELINSDKN